MTYSSVEGWKAAQNRQPGLSLPPGMATVKPIPALRKNLIGTAMDRAKTGHSAHVQKWRSKSIAQHQPIVEHVRCNPATRLAVIALGAGRNPIDAFADKRSSPAMAVALPFNRRMLATHAGVAAFGGDGKTEWKAEVALDREHNRNVVLQFCCATILLRYNFVVLQSDTIRLVAELDSKPENIAEKVSQTPTSALF